MNRLVIPLLLATHAPTIQASYGAHMLVDVEKSLNQFWVEAEVDNLASNYVSLKFIVFPIKNSSPVKLEIQFEAPEYHRMEDIIYSFKGSDNSWLIEDYVYPFENYFEIYLPSLRVGQTTEFSISWRGTPVDQIRAYALLTTDTSQFIQQWHGERFIP